MAKARLIWKKICRSKDFTGLSSDTVRLAFILILITTDDFGRTEGDAEMVKANCFPRDNAKTLQLIETFLDELFMKKVVYRWTDGDGCKYIMFPNFDKYQKFRKDRPRKNEFPGPPEKEYKKWLSDGCQLSTNGIPLDNQRYASSLSLSLSKEKKEKSNFFAFLKPKKPNNKTFFKEPSDEDVSLFTAAKKQLAKNCTEERVTTWLKELHPSFHSELESFLNESYPQGYPQGGENTKGEK